MQSESNMIVICDDLGNKMAELFNFIPDKFSYDEIDYLNFEVNIHYDEQILKFKDETTLSELSYTKLALEKIYNGDWEQYHFNERSNLGITFEKKVQDGNELIIISIKYTMFNPLMDVSFEIIRKIDYLNDLILQFDSIVQLLNSSPHSGPKIKSIKFKND